MHGRRPPITFHLEVFDASATALLFLIEARVDPARSCKPSASAIGRSAEIDIGAMLLPGLPSSRGGRCELPFPIKPKYALLSHIGVKSHSWPPAGVGRRPMRSAGLMPESNLEKSLSAKALPSEFGIAI